MINEKMYGLGDEPSAIRELFAYGMARKAEIGAENVFDFSIWIRWPFTPIRRRRGCPR